MIETEISTQAKFMRTQWRDKKNKEDDLEKLCKARVGEMGAF